MDRLDRLWTDVHDEGLPFATTVNEERVFETLCDLNAANAIDKPVDARVRQWMRFNRGLSVYEEPAYLEWVEGVYARIEAVLDDARQKNDAVILWTSSHTVHGGANQPRENKDGGDGRAE